MCSVKKWFLLVIALYASYYNVEAVDFRASLRLLNIVGGAGANIAQRLNERAALQDSAIHHNHYKLLALKCKIASAACQTCNYALEPFMSPFHVLSDKKHLATKAAMLMRNGMVIKQALKELKEMQHSQEDLIPLIPEEIPNYPAQRKALFATLMCDVVEGLAAGVSWYFTENNDLTVSERFKYRALYEIIRALSLALKQGIEYSTLNHQQRVEQSDLHLITYATLAVEAGVAGHDAYTAFGNTTPQVVGTYNVDGCSICLENYGQDHPRFELAACHHAFGKGCMKAHMISSTTKECPYCRAQIALDDFGRLGVSALFANVKTVTDTVYVVIRLLPLLFGS